MVDHGFATQHSMSLTNFHSSLKPLGLGVLKQWHCVKRIKSSHNCKAAVADGFATATFLNTKQAHT